MFQIPIGLWLRDPWLIAMVVVGAVIFGVLTVIWGVRAHRLKVSAGREDLIGKIAEVKTVIDPKGTIIVEGERWLAISKDGCIKHGEEVLITKVDGLKLSYTKK